jgi:hypothetical protein
MKLSSVEWLFQQLWEKPKDKMEWYALFKEAKEMHKQEIINAWDDGIDSFSTRNAEQYYIEKYIIKNKLQ